MTSQKDEALMNFEKLLDLLIQLKFLSFTIADHAKSKSELFISNESVRRRFRKVTEMLLDDFHIQIYVSEKRIFPNFMKVAKTCLILSLFEVLLSSQNFL